MIILKGVPFLLPAGKRVGTVGTAQLASKKKHIFQNIKFSNVIISLISMHYRPLRI